MFAGPCLSVGVLVPRELQVWRVNPGLEHPDLTLFSWHPPGVHQPRNRPTQKSKMPHTAGSPLSHAVSMFLVKYPKSWRLFNLGAGIARKKHKPREISIHGKDPPYNSARHQVGWLLVVDHPIGRFPGTSFGWLNPPHQVRKSGRFPRCGLKQP